MEKKGIAQSVFKNFKKDLRGCLKRFSARREDDGVHLVRLGRNNKVEGLFKQPLDHFGKFVRIFCGVLVVFEFTTVSEAASGKPNTSRLKSNERRLLIQGHRGSRGTHPENSLSAFEEALDANVDVIELDLVLAKNDLIVINHDPVISPKLCKTTNKQIKEPWILSKLDLEKIKSFDCGSMGNKRFPEQEKVKNSKILTLSEFLRWFSQKNIKGDFEKVKFNIEMKFRYKDEKAWASKDNSPVPESTPQDFAKTLIELLIASKVKGRFVIQSFSYEALQAVRELDSKIPLAFLVFRFDKEETLEMMRKVRASILSPYYKRVDKKLVHFFHKNGMKVIPWTVNKSEDWLKMKDYGVDEIITDYPRKAITWLKSLGEPKTLKK